MPITDESRLFMDIISRLLAIVWLYTFWLAHKRGGIPVRMRGKKEVTLAYTAWRMYILITVQSVFVIVPVLVWGAELFDIFPTPRAHPLVFLWFWSSIIVLPITYIIMAFAEKYAHNNSKQKRDNRSTGHTN